MHFSSSILLVTLTAAGTAADRAANLRRFADSLPHHEHSGMSH